MSAELKGELREGVGSRQSRKLRAAGSIPCNIQGVPGDNLNFSIDEREFFTARRSHEHLFDIQLGGDVETALVRELQWDSMGERLLHVEFRRVVRGQELEVEVGFEFVGQAREGFVQPIADRVTVAAIPSLIPESIVVRVPELELGVHLMAADLELPEGVRMVSPPETEVAILTIGRVIADEPEPEAEVAEGLEGAEAGEGADAGEEASPAPAEGDES